MKKRVKIPSNTQINVLYQSAKACVVCKSQDIVQIHHIDKNPSNNKESNLVVLCPKCHDAAHTKHDLTMNLTPDRLVKIKKKWLSEVCEKNKQAMTNLKGKSLINWTYFNFSQLPKYFITHGIDYIDKEYQILLKEKIIDENLNLLRPSSCDTADAFSSVFKSIDIYQAHCLKNYFEKLTNLLIKKVNPYEMKAIWSKKEIKNLLNIGDFIFLMHGMYFKKVNSSNKEETRKVHTKAKNIKIEGYIYTIYMFGDSSFAVSFKGHSIATGFYWIKNIYTKFNILVIEVTPLALGSGDWRYYDKTPFVLRDTSRASSLNQIYGDEGIDTSDEFEEDF